jgi:hypothetical protein
MRENEMKREREKEFEWRVKLDETGDGLKGRKE